MHTVVGVRENTRVEHKTRRTRIEKLRIFGQCARYRDLDARARAHTLGGLCGGRRRVTRDAIIKKSAAFTLLCVQ